MNPSQIFEFANSLAFFTWVFLIIFSHKPWATKVVFGFTILLFSLTYAYLILSTIGDLDMDSFGSLASVKSMFQSDVAVATGWLHYLAFDLMVGLYIVTNAAKNNISRFLIIPALLLTFMFGPVGLLTYVIIRTAKMKKLSFY